MSIAIDSLDRVVIAGYSDQSTGTYSDFDFAVARLTSDGNPDPDFSGDGKQIINMGSISDYGRSVAIDAADRVVVVGGNSEFSVVRLTTAGELDPSFDLDGRSSLKYQNRTNTAQSVAIDDEGRIYIGGFANLGTTGYDFVVARMTSDGYGDGTFGDEGFQSLDFHSSVDFLTSLSLDTQGRVLLAGRSTQGSTENDFVVSRLTTAGIVDTTFGDGGKQLIDFDSSRDFTDSVTTNSQDQVLLSGWTTQPETLNDWALVQLTSEGQFDETFGQSGIVLTDIGVGGGNDRDAAVTASQSDGKVLVVGQTTFGPAVLRYNSDGSIDTTFGEDGKKILDLRSGSTPVNITTDHDDRILVSGTPARSLDFGVIRLTPDGDIDSTFGTSGTATVDFGTNSEQVKSVFVDAENRILLSGYAYTPTGNLDFAVARLTSDGAPDPSFDSDGKQTIDFGGTSDRAYAVQTDSQGRIVVSGYLLDSAVRDFAAARLNSDGSLDEMFNGTGTQIVDFYGRRDYGYDVAIDSQDRVVIAGTSHDPSTGYYSFAVSRLTDTGGFDSDFSGDGRELLNFGSAYDQATSVEVGSGDRILLGGVFQRLEQ
ncbi:hypothetical protein [Fuerstiella marisgermanici]|nr:hypothetical protein [Fuerstiella marisgermanici]